MKKRILAIIAVMVMVFSVTAMTGCGNNEVEKTEVTVLAAASLTDALGEIIAEYEKDADATITASYAGSGDLVQQIQGGAPCDIFVSASKSNMDVLEDEGYINTDTRKDLLINTLTLIATVEKADVVTMDNLTADEIGIIAIGEPETVPAGKYAVQTFESMGIIGELEGRLVYAKDVRAVLNYVESGDADCGFVYRTDAMLLNEEYGVIIGDVAEGLHDSVVYPAAILKEAPASDAAADFFEFLQSDFAKEVFVKYGFAVK